MRCEIVERFPADATVWLAQRCAQARSTAIRRVMLSSARPEEGHERALTQALDYFFNAINSYIALSCGDSADSRRVSAILAKLGNSQSRSCVEVGGMAYSVRRCRMLRAPLALDYEHALLG